MIDVTDKRAMERVIMPPSIILKQSFSDLCKSGAIISDDILNSLAKKTLLTIQDVKIWLDHLAEILRNQKRGAVKAAATRQMRSTKKSTSSEVERNSTSKDIGGQDEAYYCSTCGVDYYTDTGAFWIACDLCRKWYCANCEGLVEEPKSLNYICINCCCS